MRGGLSLLGLLLVSSMFLTSCLDSEPGVNEFEEQWKRDTTTIGNYIRSNEIPALKDASGVYFDIIEMGSGFPPKNSNEVRFAYKLSLLGSATVIQESTLLQTVSGLIPGMQVGLSLLQPGGKAVFYIPSGYAYGSNTTVSGIPANSNLRFEIELISVTIPASVTTQLGADTVAIDQWLTTNNVENVQKDSTGLRYVITEAGAGPAANLYDKVKLSYTGKVMATGTVFYTGTNEPTAVFDSRVINYIAGFQAGLTKMNAGSKATLYIPSTLGFGNQNNISIPANSNLIYEIELVEIVN